jgi:hypothetical protein
MLLQESLHGRTQHLLLVAETKVHRDLPALE